MLQWKASCSISVSQINTLLTLNLTQHSMSIISQLKKNLTQLLLMIKLSTYNSIEISLSTTISVFLYLAFGKMQI